MHAVTVISLILSMFLFRGFSKDSEWVPDPGRKIVVYVGWPLKAPTEWKRAKDYDRNHLELEDGTGVKPGEVRSHLLVYANNEVMGGTNLFAPLPPGLKFLEPKATSKQPLTLEAVQVEFGRAICRVSNGQFRMNSQGQAIYATTLRNISSQPIRILKFAGFRRVGEAYMLNTVTGAYYSADQFIAWYAAPQDGWILPGKEVSDRDNYGGGGGIWAYYGQTEDGNHFIATVQVPK
jgi:hypothetical protein